LAVRTNWVFKEPRGSGVDHTGPIEIWRVDVPPTQSSARHLCKNSTPQISRLAECLFESADLTETAAAGAGAEQIVLGHWSPTSREVLFWLGPLGVSIGTDGLAPYALDITSGQATRLAEVALLNTRYHSWAPDGSALAMTVGGYRSAMVDKWLIQYNVATQRITTPVSATEQIPGIVAWSPRGDWVAYAAVPAEETGPELADWMSWDSPAIAGRRIYLLDPATGEHYRLDGGDAFQDAPLWSDDGAVLYYAERQGDELVLMAAELATGRSEPVPGARQPLPEVAGYYGQSNLDALLALRPGGTATPPAAVVTATASVTTTPAR
jgi:dipeptidyl aminopeptidase/acylaminoacyl peptidase